MLLGGDPPTCTQPHFLPDLAILSILRQQEREDLLSLRTASRKLRDLADVVLAERFVQRWGVAAVAAPPTAAPAYAAASPSFVLRHPLAGRESLASLAVRYNTSVNQLKRINNLLAESGAASRSHIYIPMAAAAAVGKRVAFLQDEHSQRRLVVVLADGEEALPLGRPKQPRSSSGSPALVVDKLAAVLQRALRIDQSTAAFYVQQAGCDIRAAIEKFEEDKRWEAVMQRRGSRLLR